ncbi:MAG: class I SAM-dependent methyltransferase [Planctomycetaceae bacterium]
MNDYLDSQHRFHQKLYDAENVESWVFRVYGRVFRDEFGLDGTHGERMLDFGCGQGAAVRFFTNKGFDAYGVDISVPDIQYAQSIGPASNFQVIPAKPEPSDMWFGGNFDLVVSIQTLYLLNPTDLHTRLESLHAMMKPGGLIYASMMGPGHHYYSRSEDAGNGMRVVNFSSKRLTVKDYHVTFTHSEEELLHTFRMFKRKQVGYYDLKYREDEGGSFHYTYVGQKE